MFLPTSAEFFDSVDWGSGSHKGAPKRRFAEEIPVRNHTDLGPERFLKPEPPMPPDTDAEVELADWAGNPVLVPAYARHSAYWLSVLGEPAMRDFQQPEFDPAREFEYDPEDDPELPEADLPFLFPLFGEISAVVCLDKGRISATPACLPTRANTEMRPNEPALRVGTGVCFVFRVRSGASRGVVSSYVPAGVPLPASLPPRAFLDRLEWGIKQRYFVATQTVRRLA